MAVIVTKADCNLGDANAFYRVEAHNLSFWPIATYAGTTAPLSTSRYVNLLFANAGNFKGAGLSLYGTVAGDRSVVVELQHGQTATLAVASPGVVGLVSHAFAVDMPIQFTTAGTLPTGVVAGTVYYVNLCKLSATMTSNVLPSPFVASASSVLGTNSEYKAFDGNLGTVWQSNTLTTGWLKMYFGASGEMPAQRYTVYHGAGNYTLAPMDWTFEGSNDDAAWDVLDTQTNQTWAAAGTKTFNFANTTAYKYYRLNISAVNGGTSIMVYELNIYGNTADIFSLSAAPATNTLINFTGASSGTHTAWAIRSTETKTWETIRGGFTSPVNTIYDKMGTYLVDFHNFSVAYAVTTAAGTWRLKVYQTGTGGTINLLHGSDSTSYSYWVYCDTELSFSNGDTPIFAHYCEINQTANFNGVLGTAETVRGTAAVICSNTIAQTPADVSLLKCTVPAASYTLTLNGVVVMSGHSGFRAGTTLSPLTTANRLIINSGAPTVGTTRGTFLGITSLYTATQYFASRASFFAYGEYPAKIRTTLTDDVILTGLNGLSCTMTIANPCVVTRAAHGFLGNEPVIFTTTGALPNGGTATILPNTTYYVKYVNASTFRLSLTPGGADLSTAGGTQSGIHYFGASSVISVAEDMSLQGWSAGDTIIIGKQNVQGPGHLGSYVIDSISGTDITLTHTIVLNSRLSGGSVINITPAKYGVNLVDTGTNTNGGIYLYASNNQNLEGCYIKGFIVTGASARPSDDDANVNLQTQTFKNSVCVINGTGPLYCWYNVRLPRLGLTMDNVWGWQCVPEYGSIVATATTLYKSGTFTMTNVGVLNKANYYMGITAKCLCYFTNLYVENSGTVANYAILLNLGAGSIVDGVYIYGDSLLSSGSYGAIGITAVSINSVIKNVNITNCYNGIYITATAVSFGLKWENVVLSGTTLFDLYLIAGSFITTVFKNCSGITVKATADLTDTTDGTCVSYVNYEGIPNNDFDETTWGNFQRTGGTLADTTTHTVGATKYAIRMQNVLQGSPLQWKFNVPTGDITGQTLIIGVWVKINSANYYALNYNKPKMTINYDDGASSVYIEAANLTDWQYISLPVTPATAFGQIEVIISTDTDAIGSDAYVYFDDMTVFYPAGIVLSLGGLDLWSDGFPIVPPISTSVNANDVWAALESGQITPNSMGMAVKRIDLTTKNNQGLILKG
jgi:hypothetical protein